MQDHAQFGFQFTPSKQERMLGEMGASAANVHCNREARPGRSALSGTTTMSSGSPGCPVTPWLQSPTGRSGGHPSLQDPGRLTRGEPATPNVDASSFRLDVGRPDHLAPLLGFIGDELAEIDGRAYERRAAEFGEPRLDLGIGEACVDLMVEPADDLR